MKISLKESLALETIEKVVLNSYEQSLYLVSIINDDDERFVTDEKGNFLKSFNKLELQKLFSNMLSMNFGDGVYTMDFRIYNFSTINTDQIVYFSVPSMGTVSYQGNAYTNSYNPPYDGELVFTEINDGKLSGTLHFKAQDVDPASFVNMNVTNGLFSNIDY